MVETWLDGWEFLFEQDVVSLLFWRIFQDFEFEQRGKEPGSLAVYSRFAESKRPSSSHHV